MGAVISKELVWSLIRERLSEELSDSNFKIWIDPLQPLEIKETILCLGCPNSFFKSWVREHYYQRLINALKETGKKADPVKGIELEISTPRHSSAKKSENAPQRQFELPHLEVHQKLPLRFNQRFTFDRFVVGDANQYAFSASQALAAGQELNTDSLYLLSEPGLGKSHLSQALGQYVVGQNARSRVYYLTAEDFTNELVYAIKNRCVEDFKNKYRRNCDVLVLEEIHFLSGKEKVQAELSYTLDCLYEKKKKVVFTGAKLPRDIPRLGRQFASRLSNCLISTISPPDYKTRMGILERKSKDIGLQVPRRIIESLADQLKGDVRRMESCLNSLGAKSRLLNRPIDYSLVEETIGDLIEISSDVTVDEIIRLVCRYYKISKEELASRSRRKNIVLTRNVAMFLSRKLTDLSLEAIGKSFGRNHSTVLYSVNTIETRSKRDPKLKGQVELLTDKMTRKTSWDGLSL